MIEMRHTKTIFLALALVSSALAATPKAYLRGPTEEKIDKPIFLKIAGSVSDIPVHLEQVSGPEEVPMGYWSDTQGKPVYAVGTASIPGLYRFSLIAEGTPDGASKAVRSYAFWDVIVTGDEDTDDGVDLDDGQSAPSDVTRLIIGRPSALMKLSSGQKQVRFSFTPKAKKLFRIATISNGAWTMELAGPNDASNVFAVDSLHSGPGGNAQITRNLKPDGVYYVKVMPLEPYLGKPFRVLVTSHDANPEPDLIPEPTPTPKPLPTPTPQPEPVPTGELKVLYLFESSSPLTRGQELVWYSPLVDEALTKLTSTGSDGVPGWRKWDVDTDISNEGPDWAEMMASMKADIAKNGTQLPVVGIFRGGKGKVYPLPATPQELLSLIQK
jgi:hypothetical protein